MEPPSSPKVAISKEETTVSIPKKRIETAVLAVLSAYSDFKDLSQITVSIQFTSDAQIQKLNKEFRKIDHPTDVLTFPAPKFEGGPLGDIVVSVETATRQAGMRRSTVNNELVALVIHGMLHLVGFDDETPADLEKMQKAMSNIGTLVGMDIGAHWQSLYTGVEF